MLKFRSVVLMALLVLLAACGGGETPPIDGPPAPVSTLVDTGQILCYDTAVRVIDCAGTGQDGELSINPPAYTDNGNGTVTDDVTGLTWQQLDAGPAYTWDEAGSYCSGLLLGGHSDWRLPTRRELVSIVDYGVVSPTLDSRYFIGPPLDVYWTSTDYADSTVGAWYVNFNTSYVFTQNKNVSFHVRCVR